MYPYIFLDGSKVPTYSILSSIGAVFSVFLWNHLLLKKNLVRKYTFNIVMVLPGILIGGKVFGTLSTGLGNLAANRQFDLYGSIKQSGIVYYGGLFGVLLMEYLICRIRRQNFAELSDILTIGIPLFHCFGRVGCFFAGCCYGVESNSWIAFPYRVYSSQEIVKRIPVQLMEAAFELILFCILLSLYCYSEKNKIVIPKLLDIYLWSYSIFRFVIEIWRGDEIRGKFGVISFSQIISLAVIGYMILKIVIRRRGRRE